ncbi:MAG: AAA family ATPase [Melioribacteraceae bacterium]|nr:AAA family ATPase [Melioribacteraceae bacterium]
MIGQAKRLIELTNLGINSDNKGSKIVAFTSGKGGTGKSFFSLNLAFNLSSQGKKILLIDLDSNLANIDLMLNIKADSSISDFLSGKSFLSELPVEVRKGLFVIFGDSGKVDLPDKRREIIDHLFRSLRKLESEFDYIFIDTGSGVREDGLYLLSKSDFISVVINPEPTSVMDGYSTIKLLRNYFEENKILIVVNKCDEEEEGKAAFNNLNTATSHFLGINLEHWGSVKYEGQISRSIKDQKIFLEEFKNIEIEDQFSALSAKLKHYQHLVNINQ